eukprot:CAMPEP_0185189874 /NCGR_PEP_ID=MMETSP1140-20130426/6301_1 /TAXON_ID=298111 /ORGANISM="Pavlova sp., Strain CCMP459" /LENGTH=52 /DNA_ID=CAMNT_0027756463 /DNA_START=1 /DNA_END=155 /DNA_ORIENTATION=+
MCLTQVRSAPGGYMALPTPPPRSARLTAPSRAPLRACAPLRVRRSALRHPLV